jgi:hypothetical protein
MRLTDEQRMLRDVARDFARAMELRQILRG